MKLLFRMKKKKSSVSPSAEPAAEQGSPAPLAPSDPPPVALPYGSWPPLSHSAKFTHQFVSFINEQRVSVFQLPDCGIQLCYPLLVSAQVLFIGNNKILLLILSKIHAWEKNPQKTHTTQLKLSSSTNYIYGFLQYGTCWQMCIGGGKKASGLRDTLIENVQLFKKIKRKRRNRCRYFFMMRKKKQKEKRPQFLLPFPKHCFYLLNHVVRWKSTDIPFSINCIYLLIPHLYMCKYVCIYAHLLCKP